MSQIKFWIKAARLRTLPLALSCTFTGSSLAAKLGQFDFYIFAFAILTTIFLQVLSNFANDYGDFKNGADLVKDRSDRMLSSGNISEKSMKIGLILTTVLTFFSGFILLHLSFGLNQWPTFLGMLLLGVGAIWAAIKYTTGSNPYGYKGLGDLFVFLFFGLVGVFGTQFLFCGFQTLYLSTFYYALIIGFLSVSVLNLNNLRDIETDALASKITIPVRLGFQKAKVYHYWLLFLSWLFLFLVIFLEYSHAKLFLLLPVFFQINHLVVVKKCTQPQLLDSELKKVALSTFAISLILFVNSFF